MIGMAAPSTAGNPASGNPAAPNPAAGNPAARYPAARNPAAGNAAAGTPAALDDDSELLTGEAVGLNVRPASLLLRAAGALIDWLASVLLLLSLAFSIGVASKWRGLDAALGAALMVAALVLSFVLTPALVETISGGRSLGRLAVGVRIVRDDGGAIGFRHALIRALSGVLEIVLTFGGIAALVALLNSRAKRLGDLLAGTYAQHERVPRVVEPVYGVPPELTDWAALVDVGRLPDALSRRITSYLKQATRLTADSRARLAADLAREAAPYVSPIPNVRAELFLAGVAAVRRERDFAALLQERARLAALAPALTGRPHAFPDR